MLKYYRIKANYDNPDLIGLYGQCVDFQQKELFDGNVVKFKLIEIENYGAIWIEIKYLEEVTLEEVQTEEEIIIDEKLLNLTINYCIGILQICNRDVALELFNKNIVEAAEGRISYGK